MLFNWHADLQRELPSQFLVELSYVGSRGVRLIGGPTDYASTMSAELNQIDSSYLALGARLLEPVSNPFYGVITNGPLSGPTLARAQLLRPYPQFLNVQRLSPAYGNSIYHSMQLRASKRLQHGVTALISYTVSKNISDIGSAQDAYNRRLERALSEFDAPQRLTITAAWSLPFGRNRRFFRGATRRFEALVGGWQLATVETFQSGFPISFALSRYNVYAPGVVQRPDVVGDPTEGITGPVESRLGRYFNTAAFAQPADFTFGSLGPRVGWIRAPGVNNIDVRVSKDLLVAERVVVGLRASAFNVLNHPVFTAPNTTLGGSSFGRVFNQANLGRQMELAMKLSF